MSNMKMIQAMEQARQAGLQIVGRETPKRGAFAYLPTKRRQFTVRKDGVKLAGPFYHIEFVAFLEGLQIGRVV